MATIQDRPLIDQIDFLPHGFCRQKETQQRNIGWLSVAIALAIGIATASLYQTRLLMAARSDLTRAERQYFLVQNDTQKLNKLQEEMQSLDQLAELHTFLRTPWPLTQILAIVTRPLPSSITFTSVNLVMETRETSQRATPPDPKAPKLPAVAQTLQQLQSDLDRQRTVVVLNGVARDLNELHAYLGAFSDQPLVAQAELVSIENAGGTTPWCRFKARLTLRPSYGHREHADAPKMGHHSAPMETAT